MNLKITCLLLIITALTLNAQQTKLGTVNSDLVISRMPQMKTVLKRIENYGKQLDSTFQVKAKEYNDKAANYKKEAASLTDDGRKAKIQELATIEKDLGKFRQNGSRLMQIRRDEYMRPLYKKLSEVIAEIAKANGYTQILTVDGNQFGYVDDRFDITKLVLQKLDIKE